MWAVAYLPKSGPVKDSLDANAVRVVLNQVRDLIKPYRNYVFWPWAGGAVVLFFEREQADEFVSKALPTLTPEVTHSMHELGHVDAFDRPIFVMCVPRSGSWAMVQAMTNLPEVWTLARESSDMFEHLPDLALRNDSHRLVADDLDGKTASILRAGFTSGLRDRDDRLYIREPKPGRIRFLEKTPRNSLRLPFLNALFPDAYFVFLMRDPRPTVSSIMESWRNSEKFTTTDLPGWEPGEAWPARRWTLVVPPEWRQLNGKPLAAVAAHQWHKVNETLLNDVRSIPPTRHCCVTYEDLLANPEQEILRICERVAVSPDERFFKSLRAGLPTSRSTFTAPAPDKWKKNAGAMEPYLPRLLHLWEDMQAYARASRAAS